jgi:hypothetical protein
VKRLFVLLLLPVLSGCFLGWFYYPYAGLDKRRHDYLQSRPDIPQEKRDLISRGEIRIGMSTHEITASWGPPIHQTNLRTALHFTETWAYPDNRLSYQDYGALHWIEYCPCQYLHFQDGTLVAIGQ